MVDVSMDRKVLVELVSGKYDVRSWIAINRQKWAVMNVVLKYSRSLYRDFFKYTMN
jgi:hypothetical protein